MADSELDRSEKASPHKLRQAREQGQVAKSPEVAAVLVLLVALGYLYVQGAAAFTALFQFERRLLITATHFSGDSAQLWPLLHFLLAQMLVFLLPLFVLSMLAALLGNLVQTGLLWSPAALAWKTQRLNPLQGWRRLWSLRALFDCARALVKLTLLGLLLGFTLERLFQTLSTWSSLNPWLYLNSVLHRIAVVGFQAAGLLVGVAAIDAVFARWEFARNTRMSRRELKDEFKHREGDPRIRQRLRELRHEQFKRRLTLRNTRDADVLITNPTHVAVALRYRHEEMQAPQLVAKGSGAMASAMRALAGRHRVPIVRSPSLARALYRQLDIAESVPPALYGPVARIMIWVLAQQPERGATA